MSPPYTVAGKLISKPVNILEEFAIDSQPVNPNLVWVVVASPPPSLQSHPWYITSGTSNKFLVESILSAASFV